MSLHSISDIIAGAGLLLFTGTDIAVTSGFEFAPLSAIMQVGVIAVLWFWLKDNKNLFQSQSKECKEQYQDLKVTFEKEVSDQRKHYQEMIDTMKKEHLENTNNFIKLLQEQKQETNGLRDDLKNLQIKLITHLDSKD